MAKKSLSRVIHKRQNKKPNKKKIRCSNGWRFFCAVWGGSISYSTVLPGFWIIFGLFFRMFVVLQMWWVFVFPTFWFGLDLVGSALFFSGCILVFCGLSYWSYDFRVFLVRFWCNITFFLGDFKSSGALNVFHELGKK
jgi:hypothetical protein